VGLNPQLQRGDVVTTPGWLEPARMVTAKLSLIAYLKHPLRHGAEVSFHTLAAEANAQYACWNGRTEFGGTTKAQLVLKAR
jgi:hypothetical protein